MELKTYRLPQDWTMTFPADWSYEYQEKDGQNVFFPADSDLTVRATAFHAEKEGVPASSAIMEMVLLRSVPEGASPFDVPELQIEGCRVRLFRAPLIENGRQVMRIIAGIYCEGELLVVNFFGTDAAEVEPSVAYLSLVRRGLA